LLFLYLAQSNRDKHKQIIEASMIRKGLVNFFFVFPAIICALSLNSWNTLLKMSLLRFQRASQNVERLTGFNPAWYKRLPFTLSDVSISLTLKHPAMWAYNIDLNKSQHLNVLVLKSALYPEMADSNSDLLKCLNKLANTVVCFVITCISFWCNDLGQFLYTIKKIEIQVFSFIYNQTGQQ
jgi:hypothetical protein